MDKREHLKRIFSYIRALVELKNDIVYDYKRYAFNLELFNLPEHELLYLMQAGEEAAPEMAEIMAVGKPIYAACPEPPAILDEWLTGEWQDLFKGVQVKDSINRIRMIDGEEPIIVKELFSDDAQRRAEYTQWLAQREQWISECTVPALVKALYEKLYDLSVLLEKDKDRFELIIGDGMLETELEDGRSIKHPLVLERVSLHFDADKPMFSIFDTDSPATLNTRLLRNIPGLETTSLSALSAELEESGIHAFDSEPLNAFLKRLCNTLSSDCEFEPEDRKVRISVRRAPVLFIRLRNSGYIAMTDKILEDIEVCEEFSPSLLSILGEGTPVDIKIDSDNLGERIIAANGIDPDILLEKSANREQLLIAKKINQSDAVLVQGPPGTGKTHTIANLIGDLLSRGQSVLVTSQTSKALSVLRDKISEPIRPLCVTGSDDNKKQLEASLNAINEYMSAHNCEMLDEEAEQLEKRRRALIADLIYARTSLVKLVELEYHQIEVDGVVYSPKQAAEFICDTSLTSVIPDTVGLGTPMPLEDDELVQLYATNTSLTPDDEDLLALEAPDYTVLLSPTRFADHCDIEAYTADETTAHGVGYWQNSDIRDAASTAQVKKQLEVERKRLAEAQPWQIELAQIGISENGISGVYCSIDEAIPQLNRQYAELRMDIIDTEPSIPDDLLNSEVTEIFEDMLSEIDSGKINWLKIALHPKWKPVLERCVINGEKPDTGDEVAILSRYHAYRLGQKQLVNRWEKAIVSVGGPQITNGRPEEVASKIWSNVAMWLSWYINIWRRIEDELSSQGFEYDRYLDSVPVETRMQGEISSIRYMLEHDLIAFVELEYSRGNRCDSIEALAKCANMLLPFDTDRAPVIGAMRRAVETRDKVSYKAAYDEYSAVCMKRPTFEKRRGLLSKLKSLCPLWANEIALRNDVNGLAEVPSNVKESWTRSQLCGELNSRASSKIDKLQEEIANITKQLSDVTRDLIAKRAWSAQLSAMKDPERKAALATWVTIMKRIGKGTGKRAEQLMVSGELRRAMKACRRSVPVWIMPLASVAEYFEPGDEKFDVLIIDEASQVDLSGLIALYIAKKVIVVGDDKQVSPTAVGLDVETSQKLKTEFLNGVKNSALYDELVSVYDLGKANYEPITLKEHFRCVPDIINYSNYYTYNGMICPLRDAQSVSVKPAVVSVRVENGVQTRKTNENEAKMTAALICACIEQKEYRKATFGVITMLGDEQGALIERILRARLTESQYRNRRILCGNPAYFQGDERDVIFISLVDSPKGDGSALQVRREGYNDMYAKRYNVAASRAKDQMWVVHSLDPQTDLKGDDIRLKLIAHAQAPEDTAKALYKEETAAITEMESELGTALAEAGFTVDYRRRIGPYVVSMLCSDGTKRVAIECDGDRAMSTETIAFEMSKQSVLERIGWKFVRVSASSFYRDKKAAAEKLIGKISALGVSVTGKKSEENAQTLEERVRERALQILAEWEAEQTTMQVTEGE